MSLWYYDVDAFPVVQAVYPDRQNRFPEDEGFDKAFEQPLMQPNAAMTRAENDFWASADPKSSLFDWKFPDSPHAQAFLSETIHKGTEGSHTSHTMLRTVRGSLLATACPTEAPLCSPAFIT